MTAQVHVVDYGSGNVFSVQRAIEACGAEAVLASREDEIERADRVLLPGVGAFGACRQRLEERGLVEPLLAFIDSGRPFLGICVGMQLLFETSDEFGAHAGFGVVSGAVRRIPEARSDGRKRKVPHIGWNGLRAGGNDWAGTLLAGTAEGAAMYFVHSYAGVPSDARHIMAVADYGGLELCVAVAHDNVTGFQFHPEKSGPVGLSVLANFVKAT